MIYRIQLCHRDCQGQKKTNSSIVLANTCFYFKFFENIEMILFFKWAEYINSIFRNYEVNKLKIIKSTHDNLIRDDGERNEATLTMSFRPCIFWVLQILLNLVCSLINEIITLNKNKDAIMTDWKSEDQGAKTRRQMTTAQRNILSLIA